MPDFSTYTERCDHFDPNDRDAFVSLLREGMDELHLSPHDLCEHFAVSVTNVERWRAGVSAPHPVLRRRVISHLAHLVQTPAYALAS
jgi:hypothetical protein